MSDIKCPVCGSPATLEESGWCFCQNPACLCAWSAMCTEKIAALRDQVEALVAQLEEEERMVTRLREVILGSPTLRYGARSVMREPGTYALVRLDKTGLELADTERTEGSEA